MDLLYISRFSNWLAGTGILILFALMLAPLFAPHFVILNGVYFHDNIYKLADTLEFYIGLTISITLLARNNIITSALALIVLGVLGIYSPFVLIAFWLGLADSTIMLNVALQSFRLGYTVAKLTQ